MGSNRAWTFLLPETGKHTLRVEKIGTPAQRVWLDTELLAIREHACVFSGPSGSMLELRKGSGSTWSLMVNGLIVEDYAASRHGGDTSLRALRSRPEGSYMIAPDIDATGSTLKIARKFFFCALGRTHDVWVSHSKGLWEILADTKVVDRRAYDAQDCTGVSNFNFEIVDGQRLAVELRMWRSGPRDAWLYMLKVHDVEVPVAWTIEDGKVDVAPPVVVEWPYEAGLKDFYVDNSQLDHQGTLGLGFRFSKNMDALDASQTAHWSTVVRGIDDGAGWVEICCDRYLPMVVNGCPVLIALEGHSVEIAAAAQLEEQSAETPALMALPPISMQLSLPQGVSFDPDRGAYAANIRAKTGRFIFLGEFSSPEEAHQCYLEAVAVHYPERAAPASPVAPA